MLGKSSDWVSTRSRIHRLPDELKEALRLTWPRAIKQMKRKPSLRRWPQAIYRRHKCSHVS